MMQAMQSKLYVGGGLRSMLIGALSAAATTQSQPGVLLRRRTGEESVMSRLILFRREILIGWGANPQSLTLSLFAKCLEAS